MIWLYAMGAVLVWIFVAIIRLMLFDRHWNATMSRVAAIAAGDAEAGRDWRWRYDVMQRASDATYGWSLAIWRPIRSIGIEAALGDSPPE